MKFPWAILSILSIAALAFGLLLGMKSVRITETEIIDLYADDFVKKSGGFSTKVLIERIRVQLRKNEVDNSGY